MLMLLLSISRASTENFGISVCIPGNRNHGGQKSTQISEMWSDLNFKFLDVNLQENFDYKKSGHFLIAIKSQNDDMQVISQNNKDYKLIHFF